MAIIKLVNRAFSRVRKILINTTKMDSYIWIDLELTGLDLNKDTILEAACIITDTNLNPAHEGLHVIINHPEEVLNSMNSWSRVQHAKSGLTFECRKSSLSLSDAEQLLADYIKAHTNPEGVRYIAGNTVYMDKIFLEQHMPSVNNLLHYRILDVSSLKVICSNWYPEEFSKLKKKSLTHRALDDILESIKELKTYQKAFFKA